jgi:SAM-dependent methyltransferase
MSVAGYDDYASIAELYDYVTPYRARLDVQFYVEHAKQGGGPVLELGCGTGRVLIPTARAGVEITGLDSSRHMLGACRSRLEKEPAEVRSRVQLVDGDIREFRFPKTFKLVTIPFRPFQHLTTLEDQLSCLASIHRALSDDGRFVFDLFNPSLDSLVNMPVGEEAEMEPEFLTPDGRRVVRRHKMVSKDRFNQVNQSELIYYVTHPDGSEERIVHSFPMRYLFRFEAEHLLTRAGFVVEHLYADWDKSPYGSKYPGELIFVARKA